MWVNGHRLKRNRYAEHYTSSSFVSEDQTTADISAGEDQVVRAAAIDALGNHNGTVVAIDPNATTATTVMAEINREGTFTATLDKTLDPTNDGTGLIGQLGPQQTSARTASAVIPPKFLRRSSTRSWLTMKIFSSAPQKRWGVPAGRP